MLQKLEDAHRHAATLQAHAFALPPVALVFLVLVLFLLLLQWDWVRWRERALKVRQVRVVVRGGLRERESAKRELNERNTKGPHIRLDGVWRTLYPFGLLQSQQRQRTSGNPR